MTQNSPRLGDPAMQSALTFVVLTIALCFCGLNNYCRAQGTLITTDIDEVVIWGKRQPVLPLLQKSIKSMKINYLSPKIPLLVDVDYQIYGWGRKADFSFQGQIYWYAKSNNPLNYDSYFMPEQTAYISSRDSFKLSDYLLDYNDFPYGNFLRDMKKAYDKAGEKDFHTYILPETGIAPDTGSYQHVLLINTQEHIYSYANMRHGKERPMDIVIIGDFLIDEQSSAFRRIRYLFVPASEDLQKIITIFTDTTTNALFKINNLLSSDDFKVCYWEVCFEKHKDKWLPASYKVKNNLLFHPYIAGTDKERTILFHYQTKAVLNSLPPHLKKRSFPKDFSK